MLRKEREREREREERERETMRVRITRSCCSRLVAAGRRRTLSSRREVGACLRTNAAADATDADATATKERKGEERERGGGGERGTERAAHALAMSRTWDGFCGWRTNPIREDVFWGEKQPTTSTTSTTNTNGGKSSRGGDRGIGALNADADTHDASEDVVVASSLLDECTSLAECGKKVLETADPLQKALLTHEAYKRFGGGGAARRKEEEEEEEEGLLLKQLGSAVAPLEPARPKKPELVPPKLCPSPKKSGVPLSVYMIHNLAHIELNAIDLAWDTVVSFSERKLPASFYLDFLRIADDESRHLRWCLQRLSELDSFYGVIPAHNLLWEAGKATRTDLLARLVAIPMVQEARGLDAGPRLVNKLKGAGDPRSAGIVQQIALEERAHVAVGVYWFHYFCQIEEIPEERIPEVFQEIATKYCKDMIRGPFETETRELVGLMATWYNVIAL